MYNSLVLIYAVLHNVWFLSYEHCYYIILYSLVSCIFHGVLVTISFYGFGHTKMMHTQHTPTHLFVFYPFAIVVRSILFLLKIEMFLNWAKRLDPHPIIILKHVSPLKYLFPAPFA